MAGMSDQTDRVFEPEEWIPHPAPDHGDLDIPSPLYGDSLTGEAKAEYDAAVKARRGPVKERRSKGKRRRGKRH